MLTEVPRWKVPAASPLIKDPVYLSNAVKQVPKFFSEVLAYESPKKIAELAKALKSRNGGAVVKRTKAKKEDDSTTRMEAYEKAMEAYLGVGFGSGPK
jgi:hypothetical protein